MHGEANEGYDGSVEMAHGKRTSYMKQSIRGLLVLVCMLAALFACPHPALAREYSICQVDIEATVAADGSLSVKEVREFDFDGSFHGVYWKIPTGTYQGRQIETTILSVGEIVDGAYVEFEESYSGGEHTYELTTHSSYVQVKLYSSHIDEHAQFAIVYKDTNLATRYEDTSELYWKFVSDGWDVESENVTCTIHLPVPGGQEVVGGDNVRAWGHGPLDAVVGFSNGDIIYQVPGVGTSEFAEARIAFPAEWLSETRSVGYAHLSDILAEEQRWADEANAKRARMKVLIGVTEVVGFGMPISSLVAMVVLFARYKREHRPQFDDKYFRDVPSDDHPAVLGALYHDGNVDDDCLTASLMRLTDEGYAKLELITYREKGLFGMEKTEQDYCLTPLAWPSSPSGGSNNKERIDYDTMRYIFQQLVPLASRINKNRDSLFFDSLESVARKYPETYESYLKHWREAVSQACSQRGFFVDEGKSYGPLLVILGVLNFILGVGAFFVTAIFELPWFLIIGTSALGALSGIVLCIVGATQFDSLSREAIELKAQLKALRNWLKEFTRLDEAIPQDVVLWNRLLVMSVVLGVSEEVIQQLRMAAPQLLQDAALASTYGWYYHGGPSMPAKAFTSAASTAHSVSAAKIASSSSSSGGGGGGGFSGGGGGGFGGGGGGGAF